MIKIGIRGHDLKTKNDISKLREEYLSYGFSGLQLVVKKSFNDNFEQVIQSDDLKKLDIMLLGAYFNPLHPMTNKVVEGKQYFLNQIELAHKLGVPLVGTETGSLMGDPWDYMEGNHTDQSFYQVMSVFQELLAYGKQYQVDILLEGAYAHAIHSPLRVYQAINYLQCDNLKITVDIFNFLNINNYQNHLAIFKECLLLFKDRIKVLHLKDFIVVDDKLVLVELGKGIMNYQEIIRLVKAELPDVNLIFEEVIGDSIKPSYQFIASLLNANLGN